MGEMIREKTLKGRITILLFTRLMAKMKEKSLGAMTFLSTNQQAWRVDGMDHRECFSCQAAKMITGTFHNQEVCSLIRKIFNYASSPPEWERC